MNIITGKGKVIYLAPLKALASEKFHEFKLLKKIKKNNNDFISVNLATGDFDTSGNLFSNSDCIIATNEKMDSLIRQSPSWLNEISLIIVDEIHLIHSLNRGPTLEILITRLKKELPNTQLLALSATISNADEFSNWLNAKVISSQWRPVPLKEGVYLDKNMLYQDGSIENIPDFSNNSAINMAIHTVQNQGQVIIFTKTRREAVSMSKKISSVIHNHDFTFKKQNKSISYMKSKMSSTNEPNSITNELISLIQNKTAYHHAGLTTNQRKTLEDEFKNGTIKILTATPTLSAGINLQSRNVIITYHDRYSMGQYESISVFEYKQMAGRAGRPAYDEYGISTLIAKKEENKDYLYKKYILGKPERIESKLGDADALEMHLLGLISGKKLLKYIDIIDFFEGTLYSHQENQKKIIMRLNLTLEHLVKGELIKKQHDIYKPTIFGLRTSQLYITPSTAIILKKQIEMITENNFHPLKYLYLIMNTPNMPLFSLYKKEISGLTQKHSEFKDKIFTDKKPLTTSLGFSTAYDQSNFNSFDDWFNLDYPDNDDLQKLKSALTLYDWISETSEDKILDKWNVAPGDLHSSANICEWLLYSASQISLLLNKKVLSKSFLKYSKRMKYGIKDELLNLIELRSIGRFRARNLYNKNFKNIIDISQSSYTDLMKISGIGETLAKSLIDNAKSNIK